MITFSDVEIVSEVLLKRLVFVTGVPTCELRLDMLLSRVIAWTEKEALSPAAVATVFQTQGKTLDRCHVGINIIIELLSISVVILHLGLEQRVRVVVVLQIGTKVPTAIGVAG